MKITDYTNELHTGTGAGITALVGTVYHVRTSLGYVIAWCAENETELYIILGGPYQARHHKRLIDRGYTKGGLMRAVNKWVRELTGE